MAKGVSTVIQFILFFFIGLGLFITIGIVFKNYSDIFREDVASGSRMLLNSYMSSLAIVSFDTCKQCDYVQINIKIANKSADYYSQINFSKLGLNVTSQPGGKSFLTSIHNLNSTLNLTGISFSIKTVILTLTKPQNKLEVK